MADPPNTDPSCFDEVSMDDRNVSDRYSLEDAQDEGVRYVGTVVVARTIRVVDVQLPSGLPKEVTLSICVDTTEFDMLQPDGSSVESRSESDHLQFLFTVRKWTDTWKVADRSKDPEGETC